MPTQVNDWLLLKSLTEEVRDTTLSRARKQEAEHALRISICGFVEALQRDDYSLHDLSQSSPARAQQDITRSQSIPQLSSESWLQCYLNAILATSFCMCCFPVTLLKSGLFLLTSGRSPDGIIFRIDRNTSLKIAAGLAGLAPPSPRPSASTPTREALARPSRYESAVMTVVDMLWSTADADFETEIKPSLAGTWAGDVVARMQADYAAAESRRRAEPELRAARKTQRKRERQERHVERLARKRERDKEWWARQTRGVPSGKSRLSAVARRNASALPDYA